MIALLIITCGFFAIGFIVVLIKLISIKKDLRKMGKKLMKITHLQNNTNALLTTDTFDKDISVLVQGINVMLKNNRQGYLDVQQMEATLKRAITNISHDLRTPLTSAKGYLQMAESEELDENTRQRYLSIIRGRLDALTVLMDSLFVFSQAVEGNITLQRVNVGNILRDTLVGCFAELESKGFIVETNISDTPIYWNCDEEALKRVLQNLINNAVVHGKDYLHVKLNQSPEATTKGIIQITNNTENPIDITNIFERFYTADTSRTNKRTGLGLAIVKELIEKMGGSITAHKNENLLKMCIYF